MKVVVKEKSSYQQYPKLMKSNAGLIVLMVGDKTGVVVVGNDFWDKGHYADNWGMCVFKDFDGEVILSND